MGCGCINEFDLNDKIDECVFEGLDFRLFWFWWGEYFCGCWKMFVIEWWIVVIFFLEVVVDGLGEWKDLVFVW